MAGERYVLDWRGEPQLEPNGAAWERWYVRADRTVAWSELGPAQVWTYFTGVDHGLTTMPLLYQTVVMWHGDKLNGHSEHHMTRELALKGHEIMVGIVRAAVRAKR